MPLYLKGFSTNTLIVWVALYTISGYRTRIYFFPFFFFFFELDPPDCVVPEAAGTFCSAESSFAVCESVAKLSVATMADGRGFPAMDAVRSLVNDSNRFNMIDDLVRNLRHFFIV